MSQTNDVWIFKVINRLFQFWAIHPAMEYTTSVAYTGEVDFKWNFLVSSIYLKITLPMLKINVIFDAEGVETQTGIA